MNEYIISMETLLRRKKENNKKEPTLVEKSEFMTSWTCLVKENGYAGKAEQFLYDGFSFCGAEPFYQYLRKAPDQNDVLKQMFSGKNYGKDSTVTFRLVTHLFALMLNDESSSSLLAPVIKHFPSACRNKEGKRLGTGAKTVEKYLLNVLSPVVELHPLNNIDLKSEVIKNFISMFSSLIGELKQSDSLKKSAITNINRIEKWTGEYLETVDGTVAHESSEAGGFFKDLILASGGQSFHGQGNYDPSDNEIKAFVRAESLQEILMYAQTLATRLLKENDEQKKRITELEARDYNNILKLEDVLKKLEIQEITVSDLNKEKYELENQCRSLQHTLNIKEKLMEEKDKEIAERIKMSEALSRDRSRQADERLQRIASKIKIEYRDFMDALDAPMTIDLGENMRLQLLSIFEILEKGGMKIE